MLKKIFPFLFFLTLIISLLETCVSSKNDNVYYQQTVISLGLTKENPMNQIKTLFKAPYLSAALLVKELHSIPVYKIGEKELLKKDIKSAHVVWCIRALQALTGLSFKANTSEQKKYPIQEFLSRKNDLPFFAVWMSWSELYTAPKDVQEQIIDKWKDYIKKNPQFKEQNYDDKNIDKWYFGY